MMKSVRWIGVVAVLLQLVQPARATSIDAPLPAAATCFCDYFLFRSDIIHYVAVGTLSRRDNNVIRFSATTAFGSDAPEPGFHVDMNSFDVIVYGSGAKAIAFFEAGNIPHLIQAFMDSEVTFIGSPEDGAQGYLRKDYCDSGVDVWELAKFLSSYHFDALDCEEGIYSAFGLPLPPWRLPASQEGGCGGASKGGPSVLLAASVLWCATRWRRNDGGHRNRWPRCFGRKMRLSSKGQRLRPSRRAFSPDATA